MSDNGEEKLIAVARHIAKTLGHTDTMTDDILKIFSSFDNRLGEKLTKNFSYETVEQTLDSLHRQISPFLNDGPIWSNSEGVDPDAFLASLDQLISAVHDWTPLADDKHMSSFLAHAEDLLQQCVFKLQDEFRTLAQRGVNYYSADQSAANHYSDDEEDYDLCDNDALEDEDGVDSIPVAHPLTDYNVIIDALPRGVISDLHAIAKRMVTAGYGKECCHVYSACRRDFLEESFARLGLHHKLSIDDVHKMQWTELEDEINKWIKAINVALRILYPSERRLCDRVFVGSSVSDLSFMEVCRGTVIQLLNFADAVAIGSRAPERLFRVLDVYETIRDLMPEFELNFSDQYCVQLRNESIIILKRLGEGIRGIFMELENLIRRDPAKVAVPGGGLHPITRYVMNYLRAACRSRQTLEQVFEDGVGISSYRDDQSDRMGSSLAVQIEWIMQLLESNLEAKSRVYRDPALCAVFMINNARYIMQKVKDSELGALLGEDWIKKNAAKSKQYHVSYQRSSWSEALGVLKVDDHGSSGSSRVLKEKIKSFNTLFDETCKIQTSWVVFDEQLRDELRASVTVSLCLAYRSFVGRLQGVPEIAKHMDRYVKYSVDDVEARVRGLFRGNNSGGARK